MVPDVPFNNILDEYERFVRRVNQIAPEFKAVLKPGEKKRGNRDRYNDLALYYKMFNNPTLYDGIQNTMT